MASPNPKRRRILTICLTVTAVIIILVLVIVILGLTVFKPKKPVIAVNSVALTDVEFSVDILTTTVKFNVTLDAGVTVQNPNRVGFKYRDSTAYLRYKDRDVGDAAIPAGKIGARDAASMNITLTVMADRLLADRDFYNDAISGALPFQTSVKIKGKVRILFSFHVTAYANCDLLINPINQTVNQTCDYKTKL